MTSSAQAHTAAIDIWSLGMVVFLLLAMSLDPNFEGMNRMSQDELKDFLSGNFSNLNHELSINAKNFIWRCLQTMPSMRMTAFDAECHDWLCTPDKHLSFFQELDRRMLGDWKRQEELRPMPFEIPDVGRGSSPATESNVEGRFSQYFAPKIDNPLQTSEPTSTAHLVGTRCGVADAGIKVEQSLSRASEPGAKTTAFTHKQTGLDMQHTPTSKQSQLPWEGFCKPPETFVKPSPPAKRKRPSRSRFSDAALLPLNNLERHLRLPPTDRQREQVLEELKRSNAKFIIEHDSIMPETPPKVISLHQAPPIIKRQKTRDALRNSADTRDLVAANVLFR